MEFLSTSMALLGDLLAGTVVQINILNEIPLRT